ncbi:MAG TPA: tyrosine--tRNA ligase [Acidimicrobiales bacterium]|nr:tyrosine--tRNA ligase [Acidimicrobiales bacterium]
MNADLFADLQWRGLVHQMTDEDLARRLAADPLTLYHGIDATADSLHVGNLLGVVTLQRLQRAGHRPIVLLGGATSLIGDPSGKASERQMLTRNEVDANVGALGSQLERFLDFGAGEAQAALVNNADWLASVNLLEFLRDVGKHFPINVMTAKESVKTRLAGGISFTEFSYMLLQASDFLHLYDSAACRLQVGGSDQWGNITAGVELVRRVRAAEVWGLTWPLVTKADGTKFGKSEADNVWLDPGRTSPYEFFQFWIRTDDGDVGRYLRMFTMLEGEAIAELEAATRERPQEREAQRALAFEVTSAVHGLDAANEAAQTANLLFTDALLGTDKADLTWAPSTTVAWTELDDGLSVVDVLTRSGLTKSRSAARTAAQQGGVYVNNERATDPDRKLTRADLRDGNIILLRRGKRSYHVVRFR